MVIEHPGKILHEEFSDVIHVPLEAVFQEKDGPVVYLQGGKSQAVQLGQEGEEFRQESSARWLEAIKSVSLDLKAK